MSYRHLLSFVSGHHLTSEPSLIPSSWLRRTPDIIILPHQVFQQLVPAPAAWAPPGSWLEV